MQELYENYIPMRVHGVTRGVSLPDAFIVVLKERDAEACFPLLVERGGYDRVVRALQHQGDEASHLMMALAKRLGLRVAGVRMLRPNQGLKGGLVDFLDGGEVVSLSVPVDDALVVALQSRCDIYLRENEYRGQSLSGGSMALPIAAMSERLLREAIEGAVKADDFELATVLRDELRRRGNPVANGQAGE